MQRPHRARRAVVFHDDRLANGEEIIKKWRLETVARSTQVYIESMEATVLMLSAYQRGHLYMRV
jgi:hypothetical protein